LADFSMLRSSSQEQLQDGKEKHPLLKYKRGSIDNAAFDHRQESEVEGKGSGHARGTQRMFASVDHSADRKRMQSFDATAAEKSNKGKLNRLFSIHDTEAETEKEEEGEVFVIDVELDHKKNRPATKSAKAWGRAFGKAIQQAPALPETIVEKELDDENVEKTVPLITKTDSTGAVNGGAISSITKK